MRISQRGIDLIKRFEGFRSEAYLDATGRVWTIGYGSTWGVKPGQTITEEQAEMRLRADLLHYENGIDQFTRVPLNQNQFDALTSFVYNVGIYAYRESTLLKKLNAGDYAGAADEFLRWNKIRKGKHYEILRGLTRRRALERALFLKQPLTSGEELDIA